MGQTNKNHELDLNINTTKTISESKRSKITSSRRKGTIGLMNHKADSKDTLKMETNTTKGKRKQVSLEPKKKTKRKSSSSTTVTRARSETQKANSKPKQSKKGYKDETGNNDDYLPRKREEELKKQHEENNTNHPLQILGIDEAGRGPLAGPVVAAAAIIPQNIIGITDSKNYKRRAEGGIV